jgi:hypothetical protein
MAKKKMKKFRVELTMTARAEDDDKIDKEQVRKAIDEAFEENESFDAKIHSIHRQ